jgi:hypothetical protein
MNARRASASLRWPALILIPALLGAAWMLDDAEPGAEPEPPDTQVLGSLIASDESLGAFWFCAGGTGVAGGAADHTISVVNTSDQDRVATYTVYGSRPDGGERPAPVPLVGRVPAYGRVDIRLGDLLAADFVSATVEIDGGGVLVEHKITGPAGGVDRGPCSSVTSPTWTVPVGTTDTTAANAKARELLVFFNPYPADAVLDVTFSTEDGERAPEPFNGFVVPGRSVVGIDLTAAPVTLADEVAAEVVARAGRVVVDRIQIYNEPATRSGLALSSGVATAAEGWSFPVGGLSPTRSEVVVVYNPGDVAAEVDVEVRPAVSDAAVAGVEPFELTIQPHRHELLDLTNEERLQEMRAVGTPYSLIVRSADGTRVSAERLAWVTPGQPGAGVATSTGTAVAGLRLVADMAGAEAGSSLVLVNPSTETIARVELTILDPTSASVTEPVGASSYELEPGARRVIDIQDLATGSFVVLVDSNVPIVGEREVIIAGDRYEAIAVPAADGAIVAEPSLFAD